MRPAWRPPTIAPPGGGGVPLRRARTQKCNFIKGRIDRVRQVYHSYKVELRELPKSEAREYEVVRRRVGAPRAPPPPPPWQPESDHVAVP